MIKKYTLDVFIDEDKVRVEGVHEKTEGMTTDDIRLLVAVFEEYKLRFLTTLIARQLISNDKPPVKADEKKDN